MAIKIIWTDSALEDLRLIHFYYKTKVNITIADKIANAIYDRTVELGKNYRIGQEEVLLEHLNLEIRYLIEGHYKIVYVVEKEFILISTIFDCRQNPQKLQKKKI